MSDAARVTSNLPPSDSEMKRPVAAVNRADAAARSRLRPVERARVVLDAVVARRVPLRDGAEPGGTLLRRPPRRPGGRVRVPVGSRRRAAHHQHRRSSRSPPARDRTHPARARPRRRPPARDQARRPGGQAQQRRGARPLRIVRVPRGRPTPWLLLRHRGGRARDGGKPGRRGDAQRGPRGEPPAALSGLRDYVDMRLALLFAFLRTTPPINRANQPKRIIVPMFESVFLPAWLAAFAPRETPPSAAPTSGTARGEYLVRAVGHCGECHTPRTMTYATDNSRFLAGNPQGPEKSEVPNITPDPQTGLTWSEDEIAEYLATGNKPDGDVADGLMAEVIQGTLAGYRDLTKADRLAIAHYLKSLPPVRNKIGK